MGVTGYNYYGIIYVPEATEYKDIVICYDNVVTTTIKNEITVQKSVDKNMWCCG